MSYNDKGDTDGKPNHCVAVDEILKGGMIRGFNSQGEENKYPERSRYDKDVRIRGFYITSFVDTLNKNLE
jgi:hypothetical protein